MTCRWTSPGLSSRTAGAAIGGSVEGEEISNPKYDPFWKKAEELQALLFMHPQDSDVATGIAPRVKGYGALGNVIDRALWGHVIDFIRVHYAQYYFPAFNIADSAITVGAALLILDNLLEYDRARAARKRR